MSTFDLKPSHYTFDTKEPLFEIAKIEGFFNGRELPKEIRLDNSTLITNPALMIKSHIDFLKNHEHKPIYYCYYERLQKIAKSL